MMWARTFLAIGGAFAIAVVVRGATTFDGLSLLAVTFTVAGMVFTLIHLFKRQENQ